MCGDEPQSEALRTERPQPFLPKRMGNGSRGKRHTFASAQGTLVHMDTDHPDPVVSPRDESYEQLLLRDYLGVIVVCLSCDEEAA